VWRQGKASVNSELPLTMLRRRLKQPYHSRHHPRTTKSLWSFLRLFESSSAVGFMTLPSWLGSEKIKSTSSKKRLPQRLLLLMTLISGAQDSSYLFWSVAQHQTYNLMIATLIMKIIMRMSLSFPMKTGSSLWKGVLGVSDFRRRNCCRR
jgi:hypothetical protein